MKIHGQHACRAVFARRPGHIVRVYLLADLVKPFGDLLKYCAEKRLPYKIVAPDELEKLTESKHHEGICVVAVPRPPRPLPELLRAPGPGLLVALAEVGNPHNLGAILRIAAHFGARAAIVAGKGVSPAAYRTSQGGAEAIEVVPAPDLAAALEVCRKSGFKVCASSSHDGRALFAEPLPSRAVVLLGSEGEGVPPELLKKADAVVRIPGTGDVESLNVASAASVILAEWWRQNR
ncbi:MAG TPA: TrmH family RNA methyltransferase [Polyangia bacterium]|nr:TrmH family RNA methyltransferase [Polyangia bacterium]